MNAQGNLHIEGTNSSPTILFTKEGKLRIEGRLIPDNANTLFDVLINWVSNLNSTRVVFDINIEYMNTSASLQLFTLLMKLEENCLIKDLTVKWHYEEDDEDHYETGQIFEEKLYRTKFQYLSFV